MDAKTGEMGGCPVHKPTGARSLLGRTNKDWWPEALPVDMLHQHGVSPEPMVIFPCRLMISTLPAERVLAFM